MEAPATGFRIDFTSLPPWAVVSALLVGVGLMYLSVHFWTNWETVYLETDGVVTYRPMVYAMAFHPIAALLYMVGFWLIVPSVYTLAGKEAAFVAWATVGSVFEIVQFVMVKIKTGTLSELLANQRELGLLALAVALLVAFAVVTYNLFE